jgi:hypothetical protein
MLSAGPSGSEIRYRENPSESPLWAGTRLCNALTALEKPPVPERRRRSGFLQEPRRRGSAGYTGREAGVFSGGTGSAAGFRPQSGRSGGSWRPLDSCFPGIRPVTVMGMFADKDYGSSIFRSPPEAGFLSPRHRRDPGAPGGGLRRRSGPILRGCPSLGGSGGRHKGRKAAGRRERTSSHLRFHHAGGQSANIFAG